MPVSQPSGRTRAASISAALALFVGCAGAGWQATPAGQVPAGQQRPPTASIALAGGLQSVTRPLPRLGESDPTTKGVGHVFVSDATGNVVDIFTGAKQTGRLTGFHEPQGITTDRSGTLYVANTDASNVEEFAPPYRNTPTAVIADADGFPVAVAVSSSGVIAILNICSGPSCSLPGNIDFYAKGNTTLPCDVVSAGVAATPLGGAFDDKGTFYLGALNSGGVPQISEIKGGCRATTVIPLTPSNIVSYPADVQVDRSGNVAILDLPGISAAQIDIYAPPAKHSRLLSLRSTCSLSNAASPISFALTASGTDLFTADAGAQQSMEYAYPAGGNSFLQLSPTPPGLFEGVAVTPAESP